jgi:hypothetical protein
MAHLLEVVVEVVVLVLTERMRVVHHFLAAMAV